MFELHDFKANGGTTESSMFELHYIPHSELTWRIELQLLSFWISRTRPQQLTSHCWSQHPNGDHMPGKRTTTSLQADESSVEKSWSSGHLVYFFPLKFVEIHQPWPPVEIVASGVHRGGRGAWDDQRPPEIFDFGPGEVSRNGPKIIQVAGS